MTLPALTRYSTFLVGVLLLVQILVSVVFSSAGVTLGELETRVSQLSFENQLLEVRVTTSLSLQEIAKRATELGFVPSPTAYLSPETPHAQILTTQVGH